MSLLTLLTIICCLGILFRPTCSVPEDTSQERIVGGVMAPAGRYPFYGYTYRNGCGSSLIHSDILLSAAHCNQVVFGVTLSGAYTVNRTVFIGSTIRDGRDAAEAIPVQHFVQHPSKFSSIHPLE